MLNANEALKIAKEANNKSDVELKKIEHDIKNSAMNGEYNVVLYPSLPYHPRTIEKLEQFGYRITYCIDYKRQLCCYSIEWGNKEE
jgi:hypothetical protein